MSILILTSVMLLLSLSPIYSQEVSDWVESSGQCYVVNISPEIAKEQAIKAAQLNAIKSFLGHRITEIVINNKTETKDDYFELFAKLSKSTSSGRIVNSELLSSTFDYKESIPKLVVKVRVKIAKDLDQTDPSFNVKIRLEKNVLFDRGGLDSDELKFKIEASQDCYIYIFNLMANDSVQMILPNKYIHDNQYLFARDEQEYDKQFKKLSWKVNVPLNKNSSSEALWIIALKEKYDIYNDQLWRSRFIDGNSTLGALFDIQGWLLQIPFNKRTEDMYSYEIRKQ